MEKTLIILKPDAVARRLVGDIVSRFERKGLKIIGLKLERVARETIEKHYDEHRSKPFYADLVGFMTMGPVVLLAFEGPYAVEVCRRLVGKTAGYEADAGTVRGDFSLSNQFNLIHASDSVGSAEKELALFFQADELEDYALPDQEWW